MKNSFYVITVFILFIFTACSEENLCLIGSGKVEHYELSTDSFNEISLIGPVNLSVKQGQTLSVDVDAEPEIFSELTYTVKNGLLEIGFEENITCFETDLGVWVNVTLPNITAIYQSGVSEIISEGDLDVPQLDLSISGTADVTLLGQVDNQFIESSGVLVARNFNFQSKNVRLDISGIADVEILCSDKLDLEVEGSAKVLYKGKPLISQDISGELELVDAN